MPWTVTSSEGQHAEHASFPFAACAPTARPWALGGLQNSQHSITNAVRAARAPTGSGPAPRHPGLCHQRWPLGRPRLRQLGLRPNDKNVARKLPRLNRRRISRNGFVFFILISRCRSPNHCRAYSAWPSTRRAHHGNCAGRVHDLHHFSLEMNTLDLP